MTRSSRNAGILCAAVLTAVLAGGCTGTGNDPEPAASSQGGNAGAAEEPDGSGAGVEQRDTEVIVEQTVSAGLGNSADKATIGIQSLTVEGPTMVLRYVVTPDYASASDTERISLYDVWGNSSFTVEGRLIDRENLKEYEVIRDGPTDWASDVNGVATTNDSPMFAFAVFAAPEDDIDTVDIRMGHEWPEFTGVPITRP